MPMRPRSGRSLGAGMLEAEDLAALRVHSGHHVPDRSVLAGRVHRLEDQQHGMAAGCVMELLECAKFLDVLGQDLLVAGLRSVDGIDGRGPLLEVDLLALADKVILDMDLHLFLHLWPVIRQSSGSAPPGWWPYPQGSRRPLPTPRRR
jgi:hypothetical protein